MTQSIAILPCGKWLLAEWPLISMVSQGKMVQRIKHTVMCAYHLSSGEAETGEWLGLTDLESTQVSSRSSDRPCFKKSDGEWLNKTAGVALWSPHAYARVHTLIHTHTRTHSVASQGLAFIKEWLAFIKSYFPCMPTFPHLIDYAGHHWQTGSSIISV